MMTRIRIENDDDGTLTTSFVIISKVARKHVAHVFFHTGQIIFACSTQGHTCVRGDRNQK